MLAKLKLYAIALAGAALAILSALFVGRAQGRASEKIKAVKASEKAVEKANKAIREEDNEISVDTSKRDHFE